MDSMIHAAARALAAGDSLQALKHVALRDDPPALALRGIAMAQLGEHALARELLRRAGRAFGTREPVARARCVVAQAEVALAMRDFAASPRALDDARSVLEAHADRANATLALLIQARRFLLLGRLDEAAAVLCAVPVGVLTPLPAAVAALARAELALRSLAIEDAREALEQARDAARRTGIPALQAEAADAAALLDRPAARLLAGGERPSLRLQEVAALLASEALVVDGCRHGIRCGQAWLPLASRPILFTLAHALAEAWPHDAGREGLIARAFRTRRPDETHRARLRVEIGRLRALIDGLAGIDATSRGFKLRVAAGRRVAALVPPFDGEAGEIVALLADGAAWTSSALAQAMGASQRTVQRALAELEAAGRARSVGQARTRRWLAPPLTGFTTILLLPALSPLG